MVRAKKGDVMTEAEIRARKRDADAPLLLRRQRRGHEPGNAGGIRKLEKSRKPILPYLLQKEHVLANTLILAH